MIVVDNSLLIDFIYISLFSSIISSQTIQKLKETFNYDNIFNKIMSSLVSFGIGFIFSLSFYSSVLLYAFWIGLFTLIGAERLYKTFNGYFGFSSLDKNKKE